MEQKLNPSPEFLFPVSRQFCAAIEVSFPPSMAENALDYRISE
jgi:hypothetical protein